MAGKMAITTFDEAAAMMSVRVNGAYVRFKSTPDTLQRFVRPALFSTGHETFELRYFGTAFLARYRGWNFGLTTAHQSSGGDAPEAEKFVVVIESGGQRLAVPPSAITRPKFPTGMETLEDLTFFDYEKVDAGRRPEHLDLSGVCWSDTSKITADYSFLVGYPSRSVRMEFDESDEGKLTEFVLGWVRQDLQVGSPQALDTENRDIFVKHERSTRLSIEPDGLSGAPVFSLVCDSANERHLRFDGIITNANGDRFAVYPSALIRKVLDSIIDASAD